MRFADGEIFIKIFNLEINQRGFKTMMGKKTDEERSLEVIQEIQKAAQARSILCANACLHCIFLLYRVTSINFRTSCIDFIFRASKDLIID